VITRIGLVVVVTCSLLAGISPSAASAKDGSTKDGSSGTVACGPGTKLTAHDDLRKALQIVSRPGLIGDRTLWTVPLRAPEYGSSTRSWVLGKQAWFRLEDGPVTVTGTRVDGGAGTFHFDMPPVESYPLALNANIGPGFIPSSLEFSTGGCWKVTARLGRSRVVLFFDIDGSTRAICAQLASDLRDLSARTEQWARTQIDTITADRQERHCAS
jgi:hypothetical protein